LKKGNAWGNYLLGLVKLWYDSSKTNFAVRDNFGEAYVLISRAVKLDPSIIQAYRDLGVAYTNIGKYDEALKALNKSIEVMPDNFNAYFDRGIVKRNIGDYDGAIADYSKYIGFDPKNTGAYYNRAQIYFHDVQKFDLAIADYSRVIELDPKYWEAYFNRANVYESIGNQSAADADYKRLKELKDVTLKDYKKYVKYLYPNAPFDAVLAKEAISPGSSTIAGRACAYEAKTKFVARDTKVLLYPVTPYLEAWYALRKKQEDKSTVVYISKEAARYRREAQTNEDGMFVFDNIKPGRYFIQIIFEFTRAGTVRRDGGSSTEVVNGVLTTTNYYYDQDYRFDYTKRLEEFVDVKKEGEVTKVDLKKGWGGILAKGCSRPF
jgi:tetratricopeptide (TPR) repeat protein